MERATHADFLAAVEDALAHEGGWSEHAPDPGIVVNRHDVRLMKQQDAKRYYEIYYWAKPGLDRLPPLVARKCFDICVNCAPRSMTLILQDALTALKAGCVAEDGALGPQTIRMMHQMAEQLGEPKLVCAIAAAQLRFYESLVRQNPKFRDFIDDWTNRSRYLCGAHGSKTGRVTVHPR